MIDDPLGSAAAGPAMGRPFRVRRAARAVSPTWTCDNEGLRFASGAGRFNGVNVVTVTAW